MIDLGKGWVVYDEYKSFDLESNTGYSGGIEREGNVFWIHSATPHVRLPNWVYDKYIKLVEKKTGLKYYMRNNPRRNPTRPLRRNVAWIPILKGAGVAAGTAWATLPKEAKIGIIIGGVLLTAGVIQEIYALATGKPGIIRGAFKGVPYFAGAGATAMADKYLIPKKYEGIKYATAVGTLGLLSIGVWKMFKD